MPRRALTNALLALAVVAGPWAAAMPAHAAPRVVDPEPIDGGEGPVFEPPPPHDAAVVIDTNGPCTPVPPPGIPG